jgi:hypothetical protein
MRGCVKKKRKGIVEQASIKAVQLRTKYIQHCLWEADTRSAG